MKRSSALAARRRFLFESLERRELLAGNVLVSLNDGTLTVTGDAGSNEITIYQQADGRFTIAGLNEEVFTGPTEDILARNIVVNLGAGDDSLTIAAQPIEGAETVLPAEVLGNTTINAGDGSDDIVVSIVGMQAGTFVLPALSIKIDGGEAITNNESTQRDSVVVLNSSAASVSVKTGVGDDVVDLNNVIAVTLTVEAGPATLPTGVSDLDIVDLTTVTAATAKIDLGKNNSGNNLTLDTGLFGLLKIDGSNGVDDVEIDDTLAGLSLTLSTYGGADVVGLNNVQSGLTQADYQNLLNLVVSSFGIDLSILPFDLADLIQYLPDLPGYTTISTGDGADVVTATNLTSTLAIYIYLDAGDDQLRVDGVDSVIAFFWGGAGTDGRLVTGVDALSELELQFESILAPVDPGA
ncbi:hypothetical protein [Anatilimnocola floriformis]|uniref:hypothetical protein n=1 Tax=Anatilimnocola floriformis TaxID=2948575 RepID=UPI0020C24464|nr:hypothetical protein [Anatilimnocola floriformis]